MGDIYLTGQTAGTQVSSTFEGRHITAAESELTHPSHTDGFVDKGDPVLWGANIVGVSFKSAAAVTDHVAIDTEGIWYLSVIGTNLAGNVAIAIGDEVFINSTTAVLSADSTKATHARFGLALDAVASGATTVIAVKVHWNPALATPILQADMEEGSMVFVDKQLTNANALALATGSGIEVIAAPGANKSVVVHKVLLVADAAAGAWVEPSAPDDLVVQYNGGADITGAIEAGVMVAADVSVRTYGVLDTELTPETNVAVNLFNTGTNWTGGNVANTISVRIWYSVVDTVAFT